MPTCSECTNNATMFCGNCGKPICDHHTTHGRYCSIECASMHAHVKINEDANKLHEVSSRRNRMISLIAVIVMVGIILTVLFVKYGGA